MAQTDPIDNWTERDHLECYICDETKSITGGKYRGDLTGYSLEELRAWADRIEDEVKIRISQDKLDEARAVAEFEAELLAFEEMGAPTTRDALRWWLAGFDGMDGLSHIEWWVGLPYGFLKKRCQEIVGPHYKLIICDW